MNLLTTFSNSIKIHGEGQLRFNVDRQGNIDYIFFNIIKGMWQHGEEKRVIKKIQTLQRLKSLRSEK